MNIRIAQQTPPNLKSGIFFCWIAFFISPLFWPNILDSYIAMDLLALAAALLAAATMFFFQETQSHQTNTLSWVLLMMLVLPILVQLTFMEIRNPWRAWQMSLYIASGWLIYRMSSGSASKLFESEYWSILLAVIGNFYVIYAIFQQFLTPLFSGFELFPIWQNQATGFAGLLLHTNMQGLFLALICIALWIRSNRDQGYLPWLTASLLPCAGLLATSSRGSSITLFIGIIILLLVSKQRLSLLIKLASICALSALLAAYWHSIDTSASSLITRFEVTGVAHRLFIWDFSFKLFLEHIWLGIGAGNLISYGTEALIPTVSMHPEWHEVATHLSGGNQWTHNILLQFLVEWGIIGGVTITTLLIVIIFKCKKLFLTPNISIESGQVQAGMGLILLITHGMVSIALLQGFFLALFGLYAAAFFYHPQSIQQSHKNQRVGQIIILIIPATFLVFNWYFFVRNVSNVENAINNPMNSEQFIKPIATGMDSPWTSRTSLEWYFTRLRISNAPAQIWMNSEYLAFHFWQLHQSSQTLRYRILIAHLKDDHYTEQNLIALHAAAYPMHPVSRKLMHHIKSGHQEGEAIDIW